MKKEKIIEIWQASDDSGRYKFHIKFDIENHNFEVIDLSNSVEMLPGGDITQIFLNGERMSVMVYIKQFIDEYFFKLPKYGDDLVRQLDPSKVGVMETTTGKKSKIALEKHCIACGASFKPTGNRQLKCNTCNPPKLKVKNEKV